jgi:hypothetical protein
MLTPILKSLRKAGPYLIFAVLGVAMLYGQRGLHAVTEYVQGVDSTPVIKHDKAIYALAWAGNPVAKAILAQDSTKLAQASTEMSGAEVAAEAQASGWVPAGTVTSKLITAGGAFLFFIILQWLSQHLTHPGPTRWAKSGYSDAFDALPDGEKFSAYGRIRLYQTMLAVGALLFAALVQ